MSILVVGAGGVGGYFGGRLIESGTEVTFLVRDGRARQLSERGLVIKSPAGDAAMKVPTLTASAAGRPFELILIACKAYDLDSAIAAAKPHMAAGEGLVLPLLNGMAHIEALRAAFGADRVLGGMCQIFAALSPEGEVLHLDKPARLVFGRFKDQIARRVLEAPAAEIERVFGRANFTSKRAEPIEQSLWEKWAMLAAMAAGTCLLRGSIGAIMETAEGKSIMEELAAETAAIARAAGYGPSDQHLTSVRGLLTTAGSPAKASMLRDIEKGGPTEGAHVIGDLLGRAGELGIATPLLRLANAHLQTYDAERAKAAGA